MCSNIECVIMIVFLYFFKSGDYCKCGFATNKKTGAHINSMQFMIASMKWWNLSLFAWEWAPRLVFFGVDERVKLYKWSLQNGGYDGPWCMRIVSTKSIYTYLYTYKLLRSPTGVSNNNEEKREYVVDSFRIDMLADYWSYMVMMWSHMGAYIKWRYLRWVHPWRESKSTILYEHDATWTVRLHAKTRWTLRITWGEKHK